MNVDGGNGRLMDDVLERIDRLSLAPGDVLVVRLRNTAAVATVLERVRTQVKDQLAALGLAGVPILVCDSHVDLARVSPAAMARCGWVRAPEGQE